jgi:hypothetical protein
VYNDDKPVPIQPREEKKLLRLARKCKNAVELADKVSGTISETADLFASEYKPSSEWGEDPRQE